MAKRPRYYVEIFVEDFHGKQISLGKHKTYVENWKLYVMVPKSLALSYIVKCLHLEFSGEVPE